MPDFTISGGSRGLKVVTETLNVPILVGAAAFSEGADSIVIPVREENLTPNPVTVALVNPTYTTGIVTLATPLSPALVRRGAAITDPGTDFGGTQKVNVVTKNAAGLVTSFTVSPVAAGVSGSGAQTLTLTPPVIDATLYWLRVTHQIQATQLIAKVEMLFTDPDKVNDFNADGLDDSTITDIVVAKTLFVQGTIDMEAYYAAVGKDKN